MTFPIQNEIFHITPESRLFMQGSLAFTGNMNLYYGPGCLQVHHTFRRSF